MGTTPVATWWMIFYGALAFSALAGLAALAIEVRWKRRYQTDETDSAGAMILVLMPTSAFISFFGLSAIVKVLSV